MRAIVILASLTAVALARPDVSHLAQVQGYGYSKPTSGLTSGASTGSSTGGYNGGNNQFAGSSNNFNTATAPGTLGPLGNDDAGAAGYNGNAQSFNGNSQSASSSFGTSGSASFGVQSAGTGLNGQSGSFGGQSAGASFNGQSGSFGGQSAGAGFNGQSGSTGGQSSSFGSQSGSFGGASSGGNTFGEGVLDTRYQNSQSSASSGSFGGSQGGPNVVQGQSQSIDLTGGSAGNRVVYKPVIKQGEPIITKNFYVHAAPEEDENVRVEEKVQVVRPQKSYKIIFIKAPSSGSAFNAANYPVFPQNEEKTIVYVLSKKDDAVSEFGEIPTPPPAVTHKPEVFFIKYKTKQEAADAVANIQASFKEEAGSTSEAQTSSFGSSGSGNFGGSSSFGSSGSQSGSFGSSGSQGGNFGASAGGANNFGSTGSQAGSFGSSGSQGGNFGASAGGASNFGSTGGSSSYGSSSSGSNIASSNYRVDDDGEDANVDIGSFLPTSGGNSGSANFQSASTSSQSSFGPSGGQIAVQSTSFGPSGSSNIQQTTQFEGSSQSSSIGNGNEIVPQNIVRIDDEASFNAGQQSYLPPNCRNC